MNQLKHKLLLGLTMFVALFGLLSPAVLAIGPEQCPSDETLTPLPAKFAPDAQTCCPDGTPQSGDGVASTCFINKYVTPAVQLLSVIVGLAVTASIIIGAIEYSSSAGDPAKSAAGQKRIRNAVITLVIYIFLVAGLNFIVPGGL